jgi:hypothetical protein
MAMYDSSMLFVENDFRLYSIGSTTDGLKKDGDGSLTILIQENKPADTSNWLPAPRGSFNLTMRLYGPETSVLDGVHTDCLVYTECHKPGDSPPGHCSGPFCP